MKHTRTIAMLLAILLLAGCGGNTTADTATETGSMPATASTAEPTTSPSADTQASPPAEPASSDSSSTEGDAPDIFREAESDTSRKYDSISSAFYTGIGGRGTNTAELFADNHTLPTDSHTVGPGKTLIIGDGKTLVVPEGAELVLDAGILRIEAGGTLEVKSGGLLAILPSCNLIVSGTLANAGRVEGKYGNMEVTGGSLINSGYVGGLGIDGYQFKFSSGTITGIPNVDGVGNYYWTSVEGGHGWIKEQ